MVQFVRDDEVFLAENCRNRACIRCKSRLEDHAGLNILEEGDLLFQFHVDLHRARDCADRAGPDSIPAGGLERRLAQLGMGCQSQVIVGS